MTELDLHLKLEKCKFATDEVEYLRMIVKPGQLAMDPVKLDGIASWPTPTKVKDATTPTSPAPYSTSLRRTFLGIGPPPVRLPSIP